MIFRRKYLLILSICIVFMLTSVGCSKNKASINSFNPKDKDILKVHFIDVGQGDAELIQFNDKALLIDAGTTESSSDVVAYLKKQGISKLDFIVATHPHEDHIGGMKSVITNFQVGSFYAPKKTSNTKTFEGMVSALQDRGLKIITAKAGVRFNLDANVECEMLAPNKSDYEDINNYSAVLKITYNKTSFIFMGDAQKLSEKEILNNRFDVSSDLIKIGHHGSSTSSSKEFLTRVSPKFAVISCGKGNDYGHPHKETLKTLSEIPNLKVYRTDVSGTLLFTSDGTKISKE